MEPPHSIPEFFAASSNSLNPLSRAAESDLERHRLQGHVPYDPRCTICARGKSTFHHRRRREGSLETEMQADFAFLTTRGEVVDEETEGTINKKKLAPVRVLVTQPNASTRRERGRPMSAANTKG